MHKFEETKKTGVLSTFTVLVLVSSLAALAFSLGLQGSAADLDDRTAGFGAIIAVYIVVCAAAYIWQSRKLAREANFLYQRAIHNVLHELDETGMIAGSIKVPDLFRLVASRVNPLAGCSGSVLLLMDRTRTGLELAASAGAIQEVDPELAGSCLEARSVMTAPIEGFPMIAAVPLVRGTEAFGVMQLFFDRKPVRTVSEMHELFGSIGVRISPLVISSMVFERNQERALTDATTELPNERAFHLVLEQQIAESQRDREGRPLSILAIEIRDFDIINRSRGHAAGDAVLNFVARTAREQLRQMDLFARTRNDEFLAVLPTASEDTVREIIQRMEKAFGISKFDWGEAAPGEIRLNFGWAEFGTDGDTPKALLTRARLRRNTSSTEGRQAAVLMFPV